MTVDFRSDNTLGSSPEIIDAIVRESSGAMAGYGNDPVTARLRERCCEIFEADVAVFPVLTGTAGNALAIAAMTPAWGAVFCHEDAHIQRDELGAVEFYTGGAKLVTIPGADGKVHGEDLARSIREIAESRRTAVPACVSLTNATEAGTVYSADEMRELFAIAKKNGLRTHIDGARFANAFVSSCAGNGISPADFSWRAGADVLTFGGTKNGALAAEVIVVFRRELADELAIRYHRGGHRLSKMRFLSAQMEAYLSNDVWLRNARNANAMAARLADGISAIRVAAPAPSRSVEIIRPVEANIVFVRIAQDVASAVQKAGFLFNDWPIFGPDAWRLVTGFSTTAEDIDAFLAALRSAVA